VKARGNLLLLALAFVACNRAAPSPSSTPEAGAVSPVASGPVDATSPPPSSPPPELSARVVITGGPITENQAQTMGMQYAARRWPQYHPRFAVAMREPKDWKVLVQFQELGVGGLVIYDLYGELLDAGTSKGEH
jgi:hypothetical protein